MNILHLASEYPPQQVFGLGRFVHGLATAQAALGHTVHVVTNSLGGRQHETTEKGVQVHRVAFPPPPKPVDSSAMVSQFNTQLLERVFADRICPEATLVVAHDWLTALAGEVVARHLGARLVVTIHDLVVGKHFGALDNEAKFAGNIEHWMVRAADAVLCVSQATRTEAISRYSADPARTFAIHNAVSASEFPVPEPQRLAWFRQVLAPSEVPLILYVGRLDQEKGVEVLLRAFARVRQQGLSAHLVLAGRGALDDALRQQARAQGVEGAVTFTGYVAPPALNYLYRSAQVQVVPSLYEPFGIVALEGLLCGLPVIASDVGGLREIITSGDTGLLVPPGDDVQLAQHLTTVLQQPALAAGLATRGQALAQRKYQWTHVAQHIDTLLGGTLAAAPEVTATPPAPPAAPAPVTAAHLPAPPAVASAPPPISLLIVSKDRPFFLQQYLLSLADNAFAVTVFYLATTPAYAAAYAELAASFPAVRLVQQAERGRMQAFLRQWLAAASELVLVSVDDNLCNGRVDVAAIWQVLRDPAVFGFTLRLHPGINQTQAGDGEGTIGNPDNAAVIVFDPRSCGMPWNYVWEISSTVYRKAAVAALVALDELRTINDLEARGQARYRPEQIGKMACFRQAPMTNVFVDTGIAGSRWCLGDQLSNEQALRLYQQGAQIDVARTFVERDRLRCTHVKRLYVTGQLSNAAIVIVPARNCAAWLPRGLGSLVTQDYPDLGIIFIDDASTDSSLAMARQALAGHCDHLLLTNATRQYATANLDRAIRRHCLRSDSVIFIVDGDDWLTQPTAISAMMAAHTQYDVVWSQFIVHPTSAPGFCAPLPGPEVRRQPWVTSHLRSFKKYLYDAIRDEDLRDADGQYYRKTGDQALMLPILELAGRARCHFLDKPLYAYNRATPDNDDKDGGHTEQRRCEQRIRAQPPYAPLALRPAPPAPAAPHSIAAAPAPVTTATVGAPAATPLPPVAASDLLLLILVCRKDFALLEDNRPQLTALHRAGVRVVFLADAGDTAALQPNWGQVTIVLESNVPARYELLPHKCLAGYRAALQWPWEWLVKLDADTLLMGDPLAWLAAHPTADTLGSPSTFAPVLDAVARAAPPDAPADTLARLGQRYLQGFAYAVRRRALERALPVASAVIGRLRAEDALFTLALAATGARIAFDPALNAYVDAAQPILNLAAPVLHVEERAPALRQPLVAFAQRQFQAGTGATATMPTVEIEPPTAPPACTLSIIIPTADRVAYTLRLLATLPAPALVAADAEIVLIDGGHDDALAHALRQSDHPHLRYFHAAPERPYNLARARNCGLRAARGQWVLLLDGDLLAPPDLLPHLLARLRREDSIAVFAPCLKLLPAQQADLENGLHDAGRDFGALAEQSQAQRLEPPCGAFVAARRDVLLHLRGYDEDFVGHGFEDVELYARLQAAGVRFVAAPECTVLHQFHGYAADWNTTAAAHQNRARVSPAPGGHARSVNAGRPWGQLAATPLTTTALRWLELQPTTAVAAPPPAASAQRGLLLWCDGATLTTLRAVHVYLQQQDVGEPQEWVLSPTAPAASALLASAAAAGISLVRDTLAQIMTRLPRLRLTVVLGDAGSAADLLATARALGATVVTAADLLAMPPGASSAPAPTPATRPRKIIFQEWGGLGDNLQLSTLPEGFHAAGYDTYISRRNAVRHPAIHDLIWGRNPYVLGLSDEPPNVVITGVPEDPAQSMVANLERHYLGAVRHHWPKVYHTPTPLPAFAAATLVDLNSHSVDYRPARAAIIAHLRTLHATGEPLIILRNRQPTRYHVDLADEFGSDLPTYTPADLDALCAALASCRRYVGVLSGAYNLACALRQDGPRPEIIAFCRTVDRQRGHFIYPHVRYLEVLP